MFEHANLCCSGMRVLLLQAAHVLTTLFAMFAMFAGAHHCIRAAAHFMLPLAEMSQFSEYLLCTCCVIGVSASRGSANQRMSLLLASLMSLRATHQYSPVVCLCSNHCTYLCLTVWLPPLHSPSPCSSPNHSCSAWSHSWGACPDHGSNSNSLANHRWLAFSTAASC